MPAVKLEDRLRHVYIVYISCVPCEFQLAVSCTDVCVSRAASRAATGGLYTAILRDPHGDKSVVRTVRT